MWIRWLDLAAILPSSNRIPETLISFDRPASTQTPLVAPGLGWLVGLILILFGLRALESAALSGSGPRSP